MRFSVVCALLIAGGCSLITFAGCHRGFYRRQADREAQALIQQKACDPRWNLQDTTINISHESRMFDPFSADHPPMPFDDPTSHQLMERVDDKPAYPHWHANGDTKYAENPEWIAHLPINDKGEVEMDLATAFRLALIHSTDYQSQRESLFLSALDVSLQRFGFDSQLFAGFNMFAENRGSLSGGGSSSTLETSLGNQGIRLQKLGITGSTLVIGLANTMIWQFAGPDTQTASTLIDFSVIQPLLQGGGRDRVMESLTQSERTLLANVRQMERYRRGFYLQVITGRNPGQGPGGSFLGAPGRANLGVGGVLGILQSQQQIRIQEYQVNSLRNVLEQFVEEKKAGRIPPLQVAQTQTQLYTAQNSLLSQKNGYQSSLDSFKQQLGLPPDLPIVINDPILNQFELIDSENNGRQQEIDDMKKEFGEQLLKINDIIAKNEVRFGGNEYGLSVWTKELKDELVKFKPLMKKISPVAEKIREQDAKRVLKDFERYESVRADRINDLKDLRKFIDENAGKGPYSVDRDLLNDAGKDVPFDPSPDAEVLLDPAVLARPAELRKNYNKIFKDPEGIKDLPLTEKTIVELESILDELVNLEPAGPFVLRLPLQNMTITAPNITWVRIEIDKPRAMELYRQVKTNLIDRIPEILTDLRGYSIDLSVLQARARTDSISVPKIEITAQQAIKIAREFRRDWMNARAALVDEWRQIEFVADDLESTLDLVLSGSVSNNTSNPFSIRTETGTIRGGFQFDTPITRMSERNSYRQILIRYQQSKRQYYEFEDAIKANLREIIRQIALNRVQFEINRRGVKISISQVEESRLNLSAPLRVGQTTRSSTLSRDLTDAIGNLQSDQNQFLDVWVRLESLRRSLDFDMGTMQLDEQGYWIDPGKFDTSVSARTAAKYGIDCDPLSGELILVPQGQPNSQPDNELAPGDSNGGDSNPTQLLRQDGGTTIQKNRNMGRSQRRLLGRLRDQQPAKTTDSKSPVEHQSDNTQSISQYDYGNLIDRVGNPLETDGIRPKTARLDQLLRPRRSSNDKNRKSP